MLVTIPLQQDLIHRADSAGPHFFTIPSPAEGSTNSTWPHKGQAKVTRVLVFFWTSGGGRHEATSGVHPPFGCVQMRELEREAEAQFRVLTFSICSLVELSVSKKRPLGGGRGDPRKSVPVETMRVSVRVRLFVVMEGAQLVPLAQSRGPFSPSRSTWRLSWAGLCCKAIVPSRPRPCV